MPLAMPLLKLPCLCSSPPSLTPLPPLFLLIRRPRVVASVRAMLTATPVSPPATLSPSALTAALVPRDVQVDFDDKTSWEYLFKVYWVFLKEKLALTLDELTNATNPWKELREASANIEPKNQNDVADLINSYRSLYPKWVFDLRGSVSSKRRRLHLLRLQLMFLLSLQHLYPERFIYL
ncbi:hypothetical protein ES319_D12G041100v1 [Gossypium barbadense]|uniref:Uncharacterized protein n=1 Tax=Gossypium barbadense TaxID=3634 RepID=A0A5J5NY06_GOSBA|nr:hypothetical protein ES319_D12G041100v1 [Gossypium barbadense]KAB1997692.1 hypothetical protein ES319_D12G041100v1 [Gossypium barbadense]KAB1997693.1 hypothetical protein ES319_D12G041100v1 [Gossypium barbadense]KAB1997694.1 hypothetical protein ES319_D12G041100v1 [Gossypium barbadense]